MHYEKGNKFIIEIGEVFHGDVVADTAIYEDHELYRIKGFSSLVFDENGLNKLKEYKESPFTQEDCDRARKEGYEQGLKDAWEAARKIDSYCGNNEPLDEMFGEHGIADIKRHFTAAEAISKIKAEEQKKMQKEIKVGDEMQNNVTKEKGVVVFLKDLFSYPTYCLFGNSGIFSLEGELLNYWERTGKRYDIEGILKAMKED